MFFANFIDWCGAFVFSNLTSLVALAMRITLEDPDKQRKKRRKKEKTATDVATSKPTKQKKQRQCSTKMKTKLKASIALIAMALLTSLGQASADSSLVLWRQEIPGVTSSVNVSTNTVDHPFGVNIDMVTFKLTAKNGSATPKKITVKVLPGSTVPTRIRLFRNPGVSERLLSEVSSPVGPDVELTISASQAAAISDGSTATYFVRATYAGVGSPGSAYGNYGMIGITSVDYTTSGGAAVHLTPSAPFVGTEQRMFPVAATWSLSGTPSVATANGPDGQTSTMEATFPLRVTVEGGEVDVPKPSDFAIVARIGRDVVPCVVTGATPNPLVSSVDSAYSVRISVTARIPFGSFVESPFARSGQVVFEVVQINWTAKGTTPFTAEQSWGLEAFRTSPATLRVAGDSVKGRVPPIGFKLWEKMTELSLPDATGYPGQVVSEGGKILISSTNPNQVRRVVFPVADGPNKAQMLQVNADITQAGMVPHIFAPSDPEGDNYSSLVEYGIQDVAEVTNDEGRVVQVDFSVNVSGMEMYGVMRRTGNYSALVTMYWGNGCAQGIPGEHLDLLDLSGSLPPVAPATGKAYDRRFKFALTSCSMTPGQPRQDGGEGTIGGKYNLFVVTEPMATFVQGSTDLRHWETVPSACEDLVQNPADSNWIGVMRVPLDSLPASFQGSDKVYFRPALR